MLAPGPRILLYHRVTEVASDPWGLCVSPRHFAEHLEVLQKYGVCMQIQQLAQMLQDKKLPRQAVAVTFDDGYADNLYNAKLLLEHYNYPATVFLTSGGVGNPREFWWDELDRLLLQPGILPDRLRLTINGLTYQWELGEATHYSQEACWQHRSWRIEESDAPPGGRQALYYDLWKLLYPLPDDEQQKVLEQLQGWAGVASEGRLTHRTLSVDEVVALAQDDLIEIGAHSVTHASLPTLSRASQWAEIHQNKVHLEELLGRTVRSFAYPYGKYTQETISVVREAGFICACSTIGQHVQRHTAPFQLPRMYVGDWDGDEFAKWLLS
jgi:peptidoglycan/xylan/chitin deacetylase (PgdA/CDA1 family)